jgi:hypothetical protein
MLYSLSYRPGRRALIFGRVVAIAHERRTKVLLIAVQKHGAIRLILVLFFKPEALPILRALDTSTFPLAVPQRFLPSFVQAKDDSPTGPRMGSSFATAIRSRCKLQLGLKRNYPL